MAQYKYSFQGYDREKMARAVGREMSISTKQSIEICSFLRDKNIEMAKSILNEAVLIKKPIPFKRFTNGVGHRRGMASGRYCPKACGEILALIESAEINAQQKGIDTSSLVFAHISAQKAAKSMRYSRHSGRRAKNTHIEVVLKEGAEQEKKKEKRKEKGKEKENKKEEQESSKKAPKELEKRELENQEGLKND